jgi:hypothetical protein
MLRKKVKAVSSFAANPNAIKFSTSTFTFSLP